MKKILLIVCTALVFAGCAEPVYLIFSPEVSMSGDFRFDRHRYWMDAFPYVFIHIRHPEVEIRDIKFQEGKRVREKVGIFADTYIQRLYVAPNSSNNVRLCVEVFGKKGKYLGCAVQDFYFYGGTYQPRHIYWDIRVGDIAFSSCGSCKEMLQTFPYY